MDYTRRLIHVPILHSPADMGSLAEGMAVAIVNRFGRRHWDDYLTLLNSFWQTVRSELEGLALDYQQVSLYQDGLPICGKELELVEKIASAGSQNHQLLLELVAKGATLMGTEDPRLLLDEYSDMKSALANRPKTACESKQASGDTQYKERLSKRDAFISQWIDKSLRPGAIGILFMGMMHNVESFLPADIVVTRLVQPGLERKGKAHHGL